MFAKVYRSLFYGSMTGQHDLQLVFICLLAHCNHKGVVDLNSSVVAALTGIPLERVSKSLVTLEAPDPGSRTLDEEGRRIIRTVGPTVDYWQVTNYAKFRARRFDDHPSSGDYVADDVVARRRRSGYVYYAATVASDQVKIGVSKNPWARVRELSVAVPGLQVLATEIGGLELERARQVQFSQYHTAGEWFRFDGELRSHLESLGARSSYVATTAIDVEVDVDVEEKKNLISRRRSAAEREPVGFVSFYESYPRRDGRRAAAKAFEAALKRHPEYRGLDLAAAAKVFAGQCQREGKEARFIPMPATWLNQDRFREFFDEGIPDAQTPHHEAR